MESSSNPVREPPPITSICLVCATIVVKVEQEGEEEEEEEVETTRQGDVEDPVVIWNYLLRAFRIRQNRERYRWDLRSGELVPLCGACKEELVPLLELQRKVDKLLEVIEGGIAELKDKWRRSEEAFQANGVYQGDERFYFTRALVLGNEVVGKNPRDKLIQCVKPCMKQRQLGGRGGRPPRRRKRIFSQLKRARADRLKEKKVANKSVIIKTSTKKQEESTAADDDDEFPEGYFIFSEDHHPSTPPPPPPAEPEPLPASSSAVSPRPITPPPPKWNADNNWDESSNSNCDSGWNEEDNNQICSSSSSRQSRSRRKRASALTRERIKKSLREEEDVEEVPIPEHWRTKDEDYVPPGKSLISSDVEVDDDDVGSAGSGSADSEQEDSAVYEDAHGKIRNRAYFESATGNYKYFHVTMVKLEGEGAEGEKGNLFKCSECSQVVLNSKQLLRNHVLRQHTSLTKCRECGTVKPTLDALKAHVNRVHRRRVVDKPSSECRRVPCHICGRPVIKKSSKMRDHLWSHYSEEERKEAMASGERVPVRLRHTCQCEVCGLHVSNQIILRKHVASFHSGPKAPPEKQLCQQCGKSVVDLELHVRRIHEARDPQVRKQFVCGVCSKAFGTQHSLVSHKKIHDKQFSCEICGLVFAHDFQLRKHVRDKHPTT